MPSLDAGSNKMISAMCLKYRICVLLSIISLRATSFVIPTAKPYHRALFARGRDDFDFSYYDNVGNDDDDGSRSSRSYSNSNSNRGSNNDSNRDSNSGNDADGRFASQEEQQRGGMYKVYFDGEVDPSETNLDWEVCSSSDGKLQSQVLLPPASVARPSTVIHFVGGTFFGSAPKIWYGDLLEGLVRNTNCAVIATPIPVTLLRSPLRHIELCKRLQKSFRYAWKNVLLDEYGADALKDLPVCGLGHSLGSRLLVILDTLNGHGSGEILRSPPPYKSFVLMSFTNYKASAGIPGLQTLLSESKRNELSATVTSERDRLKKSRKARRSYDYDDEDDDYSRSADDAAWDDLVEEVQEVVKEQTSRVRTALTPNADDLEFHPTPEQLWQALSKDARYSVPETLLIQFDADAIDQSAKLATVFAATNSTDVKFCRLRGDHLAPVAVNQREKMDTARWQGITSRASNSIIRLLGKSGKRGLEESVVRDLRRTVSRYITDIVTK